MATSIAKPRLEPTRTRAFVAADDVSAPGLVLPIEWAPVAGATDAEVTEATLVLQSALAEETFPDVPVASEGNHRVLTVPAGRSVAAIGVGVTLNPGERLTLSLPAQRGGWEAPIFASTGVSNGSMAPQSPRRAPFANNLFTLPDAVSAARLRLSKVTGDDIASFSPVAFDPGRVNLTATTPPRNLRVLGPDQAAVWQAPELPNGAPPVTIDLKTPLEIAFRKQLARQATPSASVTVTADAPARAFVTMGAVHGALVRLEDGITTIALDGAPRPLTLATPFASEPPSSVVGSLTVKYEGLRLLETVSDPMPAAGAAVSGVIVGPEPALRIFPPEAFDALQPARIGLVGRAPEDCEIAVEFVRIVGASAGPPLGPPAVLTLTASSTIDLHWAATAPGLVLSGPVGIRARANRGRFFWVTAGDHPAMRLAIHDPDPGDRPLTIGATPIPIVTSTLDQPAFTFPAAAFSRAFPWLSSDLFLTVTIADLTLRYAR
jgi:hypothetical protein